MTEERKCEVCGGKGYYYHSYHDIYEPCYRGCLDVRELPPTPARSEAAGGEEPIDYEVECHALWYRAQALQESIDGCALKVRQLVEERASLRQQLAAAREELSEAEAHIGALRGPLLHHFGTTDPALLAEVWQDRGEPSAEAETGGGIARADAGALANLLANLLDGLLSPSRVERDFIRRMMVELRAMDGTLAARGEAGRETEGGND